MDRASRKVALQILATRKDKVSKEFGKVVDGRVVDEYLLRTDVELEDGRFGFVNGVLDPANLPEKFIIAGLPPSAVLALAPTKDYDEYSSGNGEILEKEDGAMWLWVEGLLGYYRFKDDDDAGEFNPGDDIYVEYHRTSHFDAYIYDVEAV
ncbi:MAG: hypothetical protein LBL47_03155 [Lactobacillus sp.]|jgi:hypothetical protein|nr:hypothetical protein [Lactobacillus sp.]